MPVIATTPPDPDDEQQPDLFDNDGYEPSGLDEFAQVRPPFSDNK